MKVFQCEFFPQIPEKFIHPNVVTFIEQSIKEKVGITLKTVANGVDPIKGTKGYCGYDPCYEVAYLSNPLKDGIIGIDTEKKRLIFDQRGIPFYEHRDAYVYFYRTPFYTREDFSEVLREFERQGYTFFSFTPKIPGDTILFYSDITDVPFTERISIEDILKNT